MAVLNKDQILAASKNRKVQDVEIERLGGTVRMRELLTAEMMAFRKKTRELDDETTALRLLVLCWIDGDGERVFSGDNALDEVGAIPLDVLNDLSDAVLEVNGLAEKAVEAAGKD